MCGQGRAGMGGRGGEVMGWRERRDDCYTYSKDTTIF